MSDGNICVNWRAAVIPPQHGRPLFGRLAWVSKRRVLVRTEHNLTSGFTCRLVLMLPKHSPDAADIFVDGECAVKQSYLSGEYFHIELEWLSISGDGHSLLKARIDHFHGMWKGAV